MAEYGDERRIDFGAMSSSGTVLTAPSTITTAPAGSADAGGTSGGGGGTSAADTYAAAQKAAADAAARKYAEQVKILQAKVTPLLSLLNGGYMKALNSRLANTAKELGLKDTALLESYDKRLSGLKDNVADNEKAAADTGYANLTNRGRERASAIQEALAQGAGESDVLKATLMSLRSWDANQNEANRSLHDSLRSINSTINDLNVDTKTGRLNFASQAEADRDALWTEYYNKMGESYTQLGNVYGEQAQMFSEANEMDKSATYKSGYTSKTSLSKEAFADAAAQSSKVYIRQGPNDELKNWSGEKALKTKNNNSLFVNAKTAIGPAKKPEGATLRTWE